MPQPFTFSFQGSASLSSGPDALATRPDLAVQIALVSAHWTQLEWRLSSILLAILRGEQKAALAIYHLLIERRLRQQAIFEVVEAIQDAELTKSAEALFARVDKLATERNRIIHANWCTIDTRPDTILRRDDNEVDRMLFASEAAIRERLLAARAGRPHIGPSGTEFPPLHLQEYRCSDFLDLIVRIGEVGLKVEALATELRRRKI